MKQLLLLLCSTQHSHWYIPATTDSTDIHYTLDAVDLYNLTTLCDTTLTLEGYFHTDRQVTLCRGHIDSTVCLQPVDDGAVEVTQLALCEVALKDG